MGMSTPGAALTLIGDILHFALLLVRQKAEHRENDKASEERRAAIDAWDDQSVTVVGRK